MKFKVALLFVLAGSFLTLTVYAQDPPSEESVSGVISAFRFYKDVGSVSITVPTVVELPFGTEFIERYDFAILDTTKNSLEPYFFGYKGSDFEPTISARTEPSIENSGLMVDENAETYSEFVVPENGSGQVHINLTSSVPIASSALTVLLDDNVALPSFVEIRALVNGQNKIVVANRRLGQNSIRFPKTTADTWTVAFTFEQPLRISELRLVQENAATNNSRIIRWLAQPSHSYRIYFDPDRRTDQQVGEAGNLTDAEDIKIIPAISSQKNPNFIIADSDNDSIPDILDNCVSIANKDQIDENKNSTGDACDDFDKDGLLNARDNCPNIPNQNQTDTDGDAIGDVCDSEESRITERYTWLPWIGIGFAGVVLITLLALTALGARKGK